MQNERATLEEQLRQAESECANATSELQYAKQTIHGLTTQVDEVSAEVRCVLFTNYVEVGQCA